MAKRFGRPAPNFANESAGGGVVREIRITREGSGMEGVYDSIAAVDELHSSTAESARKRAIYDGVLHWVLMILFWGFVVLMTAHFLRNLHS